MAGKVHKAKIEKAVRVLHKTGSKTEALKAINDSDPNAHCTRFFEQKTVQDVKEQVDSEYLAAMKKEGLTSEVWARGLKTSVDVGNPAGLRLYAEVVKLVGDEQASKVLVMVQNQAAEAIVPMIMLYVPLDRMAEFRAELRQHYDHNGATRG